MILGWISDTHENPNQAIERIVRIFQGHGVEGIIHLGDIEPEHVDQGLFGNLPVYCALTDEQIKDHGAGFFKADGWVFTLPGDRIIKIGDDHYYVGHKRSWDFLVGSQSRFWEWIYGIRKEFHNVWKFGSGHTHRQVFLRSGEVDFINPGAARGSDGVAKGFEYAILNTDTGDIIFSRIQNPKPVAEPLKVAVISDTLDVTVMNPPFWSKLAERFRRDGVTHVIHCGNIYTEDIGRPELSGIEVHYNLRPGQEDRERKPDNWILVPGHSPMVKIKGYKFCVQLSMGPELFNKSEFQMHEMSKQIRLQFPEIQFLLSGSTPNAFYEEGENIVLLNPGDASRYSNFAIIGLPDYDISFGLIRPDPLPALS
jgi:predicted phosphodiesterase